MLIENTIKKYNMDCSISSDNPNTDPFKCPFNPEAGCTLSRIVYNSINSDSKTLDIDNFLKKTKSPNKENMICNIDNRFLVDTDMNLITIPVYTYKFDNIDKISVLPIDNCNELNDLTVKDDIEEKVKKISYGQSLIDYNLKVLNITSDSNDSTIDRIYNACMAKQDLLNSLIPVNKQERIMAEKVLKTASNLSSQYSNDIAYNITNNVVNKGIPIKAYETTLNTTPASIIGAIALAGVKGAFSGDNGNNNGGGGNNGNNNGGGGNISGFSNVNESYDGTNNVENKSIHYKVYDPRLNDIPSSIIAAIISTDVKGRISNNNTDEEYDG